MRPTKSSSASVPWIELEPEADAVGDDGGLADVGGAERGDDGCRAVRVGAVEVGGARAAEDALGGEEIGQELVRGADGEALGLEDRGDQPERRVVAGAQSRQQARGEAEHLEVEGQEPERRAGHAAGEDDLGDAGGAQVGEEAAGLLEAGPDQRLTDGPVERHALELDHAIGAAAGSAVLGDQAGKLAAAGDDGEAGPRHLAVSRRGR